MLLQVQLLNMAVDNGLLYVLRDVEEVVYLLQQLQLKAEARVSYSLQTSAVERLSDWNITVWENTDFTTSQQQTLHGSERENLWFMHCNGSELFIGSLARPAACT